jgi:hypothetical protein
MPEDPLQQAREALERGDYGLVLRLLEPLAGQESVASVRGADLRLIMATALMGLGQAERAAACCRALERCVDPRRRAQARDLLQVLEAPALRRPRSWSLTLPRLEGEESLQGLAPSSGRAGRADPAGPPPPPVGPTRAPLGFAVVVLLVFVLLSTLLAGCMEVGTELRFVGPGRLQVLHELRSISGQPSAWQRRFEAVLRDQGYRPVAEETGTAGELLIGPVGPARATLATLAQSLAAAAELGDMPLPPPLLEFQERNWLLGMRQRFTVELDLTGIRPPPGLDLHLGISPVSSRAIRRATPLPVRPAPAAAGTGGIRWPLQPGAINRLELRCWRWNPLGLGGLTILLMLTLVLLLQRIRRTLGYGLPELPA